MFYPKRRKALTLVVGSVKLFSNERDNEACSCTLSFRRNIEEFRADLLKLAEVLFEVREI